MKGRSNVGRGLLSLLIAVAMVTSSLPPLGPVTEVLLGPATALASGVSAGDTWYVGDTFALGEGEWFCPEDDRTGEDGLMAKCGEGSVTVPSFVLDGQDHWKGAAVHVAGYQDSGTWNDTEGDLELRFAIPQGKTSSDVPTGFKVAGGTGTEQDPYAFALVYDDPAVAVESVTLDPSTASVDVGGSVALQATVAPEDAADKTVRWSYSDPSVELYADQACETEVGAGATDALTVYAKGASAGSATVTCVSNADANKSATCEVTVSEPVAVDSVTLDPSAASVDVGGSVAITATVSPDDATDKTVVWSSSDASVELYTDEACETEVGAGATDALTVYAKGASAGTATVTCKSNADENKSATCEVTVSEPVAVDSVTLDPSTASVDVDAAVAITATVAPANAADRTVRWSSSDASVELYSDQACATAVGADATSVLTVYARGASAGSATVTCTSSADEDKSASCAVTVIEPVDDGLRTLTVCSGSSKSDYVPIYGDPSEWQRAQHIVPASMLSDMAGGAINSMKFYTNKKNVSFGGAVFQVSLKEVDFTTFSSADHVSLDGSTRVYQGTISVAGDGTMQVVFDTPYLYGGGNLLVDFRNTSTGTYSGTFVSFYGITSNGSAVQGSHINNPDKMLKYQRSFLPKTTYGYLKGGPVESVELNKTTVEIYAGSTATITPTVLPVTSDQTVTWSSDDEDVATVDADGVVTAVAPGDATITCTTDARAVTGEHLSATCEVTVSEPARCVEIGSGEDDTYLYPINSVGYSLSQQIYKASEIGTSGPVTYLSFYYTDSEPRTRDLDVYLAHTTKKYFESNPKFVKMTDEQRVFSGQVEFGGAGWVRIGLDTPFVYDGTSNLLVCVYDHTGVRTSGKMHFWYHNPSEDNNSMISKAGDSSEMGPNDLDPRTTSKEPSNVTNDRSDIQLGIVDGSAVVHKHAFSYTQEGATVKVKCKNPGCDTYTTNKEYAATLTVTGAGKSYDGKPVSATLEKDEGFPSEVQCGEVTYMGEIAETGQMYNSATPPSAVGTYYATAVVGAETAEAYFEIKGQDPMWYVSGLAYVPRALVIIMSSKVQYIPLTQGGLQILDRDGKRVMDNDWYVVKEPTIVPGDLYYGKNVNLIVPDGLVFGVTGSVKDFGSELTLYGQEGQTGTLRVQGSPNVPALEGGTIKVAGGRLEVVAGEGGTLAGGNGTIEFPAGVVAKGVDAQGNEVTLADGEADVVIPLSQLASLRSLNATTMTVAELTKAPAAVEGLVYDGTQKELVTAGEAEGGKVVYALGDDATTAPGAEAAWSQSVPEAVDAGTYHVWYKLAGDEAHADSQEKTEGGQVVKEGLPACVDATIAPATVDFVSELADMAYTGSELEPADLVAKSGEKVVPRTEGEGQAQVVNYEVTYAPDVTVENNNAKVGEGGKPLNAGTYVVTVTPKGNYGAEGGSLATALVVGPQSISAAELRDGVTDKPFQGRNVAVTQDFKVWLEGFGDDGVLDPAHDYSVSYSERAQAGTARVGAATVTVTGEGNFEGSVSQDFWIEGTSMKDAIVELYEDEGHKKPVTAGTYAYDGEAKEPHVVVRLSDGGAELVEGEDFEVAYYNNVSAGTASAFVVGDGGLAGGRTVEFPIGKAGSSISIEDQTKPYTGLPQAFDGKVEASGSTGEVGFEYYVDERLSGPVGAADVVDAGTYFVRASLAADANHEAATSEPARLTIAPAEPDVAVALADWAYGEQAKLPVLSVRLGGKAVAAGEYDPTYSYATADGTAVNGVPTEAGDYVVTATVRGKNLAEATATDDFAIRPRQLPAPEAIGDQLCTGGAVEPVVVVRDGGKQLVADVDFEVVFWLGNAKVGEAAAVVEGRGNYAGTQYATFNIVEADKADLGDALGAAGDARLPDAQVSKDGTDLEPGTEYVTPETQKALDDAIEAARKVAESPSATPEQVGQASQALKDAVTAYKDAKLAAPARKVAVPAAIDGLVYDGTEQTGVEPGDDYDVEGGKATDAGDHVATASLKDAKNTEWDLGKATTDDQKVTWRILPASIATFYVEPVEPQTYNGRDKEPELTVRDQGGRELARGIDYDVAYANNRESGLATATVTGKGNYKDKIVTQFSISNNTRSGARFEPIADQTYTSEAIVPEITIRDSDGNVLVEDKDYDLTVTNNVNVGTANVAATLKGNYSGAIAATSFKINPAKITGAAGAARTYNGKAQTTGWTVRAGELVVPASDFGVSGYKANTNAGTATATIAGKGNFTGSVTGSFKINPAKVTGATGAARTYNGKAQTTTWTVKAGSLSVPAAGFSASAYKGNTNAGAASATIKGKGNFTGSVTGKFKIGPAKITAVTTAKSAAYTGKAVRPKLGVKAGSLSVPAAGYAATWSNNVKAGTASVSVAGKGNFTGSAKTTFKIVAPSVQYKVHRQTYGWEESWSADGKVSGTTGEGKRLEAIYLKLGGGFPVRGGIRYKTHIQGIGWESAWKADGALSGTEGQAKRLEAIRVELTGAMKDAYDVYYRVHAQQLGWMAWAKNGADAGTAGYSYRLEAIQVVLVPKGGAAPAKTLKGQAQAVSEAFVQKK